MKRIILAISFLLPLLANAQNMYNVAALIENDLSGTARFVGMGGSMGALGGNLSVMRTNPAGIAVYRSNDFYISGVADIVNNKTTFNGMNSSLKNSGIALNNLGFVMACDIKDSAVKFVNFGVNYQRNGNLRNDLSMSGSSQGYSQQFVIEQLYRPYPFDINKITSDSYSGFGYNWLALLAADVDICDVDSNFLVYPDNGELVFAPDKISYHSEMRGGVNVVDFNISTNISDRFYLGATLGYHIVDYSRYTCYYETDEYGEIYSLTNNYKVSGSGVDFKLGAIFRPFKYSPFKIALSVHTPVFYKLADISNATMLGPANDEGRIEIKTNSSFCYGEDLVVAYSLETPWHYSAAMSYTFGNFLAVNAEYEYSAPSSLVFSGNSDISVAQNREILRNMKGSQHTMRLGAELSVKKFAVRAGYNYISAPFKENAFKDLDNASIADTSTEYQNKYSKSIATVGFGYAGKLFYFDMAYMYQAQNSEFYPFYDKDVKSNVAPTGVKTTGHSFVAGIGVRF